jgi:membrane associated rhomboid family serine protease
MSIIQDIRDTFSRRDNALNQLIVLNVVVFAVVVVLYAIAYLSQTSTWYEFVMRQLELSANLRVLAFHPWTVLTYAFVHQNPFHILFNMLNLYFFGQIIREYLGDQRLVSIYVLGGLAGALAFLLAYNLLPVLQPGALTGQAVIGASAAAIAVVVAAATLLPDYTFMLILLGPVKIKWIAAALVLISIAAINQGNTGGEITHIGGALLGFVFIKMLNMGRDMGRPVTAVGEWFGRVFSQRSGGMRFPHRQPVATATRSADSSAKGNGSGVAGQDEIDLILDKISHSGYESLSKDEKQKLFRASQQ